MTNELSDAMTALSVALVFLVMFQGYVSAEYQRLKAEPVKRGEHAVSSQRRRLNSFLWGKLIPLALAQAASFYVFLPLTMKLLDHSTFRLVRFETVPTAFLLVQFFIVAMLVIQVFTIVGTVRKSSSVHE